MSAQSYHYRFRLVDKTKDQIRRMDEDGWQQLFESILRGMPVPYNIDFSEFDPITRLCELYAIVMTLRLDPRPYQTALTRLLLEHYGNSHEADLLYDLISTVDYVRPSGFYNRLLPLVTKPEYSAMLTTTAPDGYLIHFHLINAIMSFDTDRKLLDYLLALKDQEQLPEYYQVTIRYLYNYCGQAQFDFFMNGVVGMLTNDRIRAFVVNAFEEYVFYKHEFGLLYRWLFGERKRISGSAFLRLGKDVLALLERKEQEYVGYRGFGQTRALLGTICPGEYVVTVNKIGELILMDAGDVYSQDELIEYLGEQNPRFVVESRDDGMVIRGGGGETAPLPKEKAKVINLFEDGTYKGIQQNFRASSRRSMSLPGPDVRKSMRDDDIQQVDFELKAKMN